MENYRVESELSGIRCDVVVVGAAIVGALLLNAFILFRILISKIKYSRPKFFIIYSLLFIIFIVYPAYNRKDTLASIINYKLINLNSNFLQPKLYREAEKFYAKEVDLINKNLSSKEVLILSNDDTYLFYLTDKQNLLQENPQSGISSQEELDHALQKALLKCPQNIAVNCSLYKRCPKYTFFNQKTSGIQKFLLGKLQKECRVKYKPTACSSKLCVAIQRPNSN